ncbi:MAG: hypothetical protein GC149_16000 [Gammaproteobacteria bacterium]|nr:hypothetical protein [Gammaproteobacteria bacterium]
MKRSLLLELQKNFNLVHLFLDNESKVTSVINKLDVRAYEEAVRSEFDFKSIKRGKLSPRIIANIKQLQPYAGWTTEQLFENVYLKIHQLKNINEIDPGNEKYRIGIRLKNLHKMMLLLIKHVKS